MAGTLTISTLSDGTNSTSATNPIRGSAKAWGSFANTGSSLTLNSAYNVSSVTYVSAGQYTVNFTTAFADTNYAIVATSGSASTSLIAAMQPSGSFPPTTTSCRLNTNYANAAPYDGTCLYFAVFR
jgi:hypothetical protein